MTMTAPPVGGGSPPAGSDCICGGGGTVFVDDDYVNRQAARVNRGDDGALPPGTLEALRWSVIPCYECRPTQYRLWTEGHYRKDHRPCPTCRPKRKGGQQQRRHSGA